MQPSLLLLKILSAKNLKGRSMERPYDNNYLQLFTSNITLNKLLGEF